MKHFSKDKSKENQNNEDERAVLNQVGSVSLDEVPVAFICPITREIMKDPVIDRDGNSFEREAILSWLHQGKNVSPLTRKPLRETDLTPNRALKDQIDVFRSLKDKESKKSEKQEEDYDNNGYVVVGNDDLAVNLAFQDAASIDGTSNKSDMYCLATIKAAQPREKRAPIDVCCVIDVSGSMGAVATIKNESGQSESNGLTVLDVVKHGVRAMMEVLTPQDSMSIVEYSTNARVVCPLLKMDDEGKKKINLGLANMVPTSSTNLWDGLHKGMEVIAGRPKEDLHKPAFVMLLTDGLPNIVPPRGHIPMLKRYLDQNSDLDVTINTYGFGYSLDSSLLNDIATTTNGMYCFIPDSSFVGTIFVNSISNALSTSATNVKLALEPSDETPFEIEKVYGDQTQVKKASWGVQVNMGNIQHGQERSVLCRLKMKEGGNSKSTKASDLLSATLNYTPLSKSGKNVVISNDVSVYENCQAQIQEALYRLSIHDTVTKSISILSPTDAARVQYNSETFEKRVKPMLGELASLYTSISKTTKTEFLAALEQDVNGQISMGLSTEKAYKKWGKHFLLSLMRAHSLQICLNFKDPGVQFYGGKIFNQIRDLADDKFNKLPAPKPRRGYTGTRVASMRSYNSRSAGCFDGEGKVTLSDGISTKLVKDLRKGDQILARNGKIAKVVCMIRTQMRNSQCEMVKLQNGVKLTPWHPVFIDNTWKFPNNIGKLKLYDGIDYIYNAVVDQGHSLMINGVHCVTLGHHLTENKVVEHPYFGTDLVLDSLKSLDPQGWAKGYIDMQEGVHKTLRDHETGLIHGMTRIDTNVDVFSCKEEKQESFD